MKIITILSLTVLSLAALSANADLTKAQLGHLSYGAYQLREVEHVEGFEALKYFPKSVQGQLRDKMLSDETAAGGDDPTVYFDQIINIGTKIWKIISDNQPVMNFNSVSANALPAGIGSWEKMEGWQTPVSRTYGLVYKNLYGMEVVDFDFRVLYTYGGSYKKTGKYLSNISVLPATVAVDWGYTFNAGGSVPNVVNSGTSQNPLAGAEIRVDWKVETVIRKIEESASFFVKGNGEYTDLN